MRSSSRVQLPLLAQRSIADSRAAQASLSADYELQLTGRLSDAGASITCRKGCNLCCYHPVFATLLEGAAIYQSLIDQGKWSLTLKESLQKHHEQVRGLAPEVWILSMLACPLLDDQGLCKTYLNLPFQCRNTYSIGNPENCHPHHIGFGMMPRTELFQAITPAETNILRRHNLQHFRIPLSVAILYGERIVTGEIELEDCRQAILETPYA